VTLWPVSPPGTCQTILDPTRIRRIDGFHVHPFTHEPVMTFVRAGATSGSNTTAPTAKAVTSNNAAGLRTRAILIQPHPLGSTGFKPNVTEAYTVGGRRADGTTIAFLDPVAAYGDGREPP
jgi:hypothetical protein